MAGDVVNIKVCNPLKLRSGLTGNYHAICHYSYNLPLGSIQKKRKRPHLHKTTQKKKNIVSFEKK